MQLEADAEEPDVIIPWAIVMAVVFFACFLILAIALGRSGSTPLDQVFAIQRHPVSPDSPDWMREFMRRFIVKMVAGQLSGWEGLTMVSALVLVRAFISNRRSAPFHFLLGPLPAINVHRKEALVDGEILIALAVSMWLLDVGLSQLPYDISKNLAYNLYVADAIAFWGTLLRMAWRRGWNVYWRYLLTAAFAIIVLFEFFAMLYLGVRMTTLLASAVFGVAILCAATWVVDRYCVSHGHHENAS